MNRNAGTGILWTVNVLLFGLGVWVSLFTYQELARIMPRIGTLRGDLKQLSALERKQGEQAVFVKAFDKLEANRPINLSALLGKAAPGTSPEITEDKTVSTGFGWRVRRAHVTIEDIELTALGRFLQLAETQRPPWRMQGCAIQAAAGNGARGRVELVMEALEKSTE